ncbi:MAG: acyl-ACP--UDP-N-acetylglucosamine O-acyltransferase [Candidatus Obscuribacterales bacterium]|nr:acyl-ACP--UDP-N-acetylglucosamine O-acyltransferase [Candidatus Obscuribacterales bacterium]
MVSQTMSIHKTAIISDGAKIAEDVEIGPYVVIGENVSVGRGTKIGPHAVIDGVTTIGEDCKIYAGASIGLPPQDLSYKDAPTGVIVGNNCTIREYVTIHRGSKDPMTLVGNNCFLMNYAHIAHDCKVGNNVIMANGTTLGGHVEVGDFTVFGGLVVFHQFVRIGRFNMVSGNSGTRVDLPPFAVTDGRPLYVRGINIVGLRRGKIPQNVRSAIKEAYRLLYRSDLNMANACSRIEEEIEQFDEIKEIVNFIRSSKRGVARGNLGNSYDTSSEEDGKAD